MVTSSIVMVCNRARPPIQSARKGETGAGGERWYLCKGASGRIEERGRQQHTELSLVNDLASRVLAHGNLRLHHPISGDAGLRTQGALPVLKGCNEHARGV
jgi:hypothetical protein